MKKILLSLSVLALLSACDNNEKLRFAKICQSSKEVCECEGSYISHILTSYEINTALDTLLELEKQKITGDMFFNLVLTGHFVDAKTSETFLQAFMICGQQD